MISAFARRGRFRLRCNRPLRRGCWFYARRGFGSSMSCLGSARDLGLRSALLTASWGECPFMRNGSWRRHLRHTLTRALNRLPRNFLRCGLRLRHFFGCRLRGRGLAVNSLFLSASGWRLRDRSFAIKTLLLAAGSMLHRRLVGARLLRRCTLSRCASRRIRHTGLLDELANRPFRELCSDGPLNRFDAGPAIDDDTPGPAAPVASFSSETSNGPASRKYAGVVEDQLSRCQSVVEVMDIHKYEGGVGHGNAARSAGRPADIIRGLAPNDPCGCPFGSRQPYPAITRIINPLAIMKTSPTPRFIAGPVPAGIRPFPVPEGVRAPIRPHVRRPPTSAVGANVDPGSVRGQRRVKIIG